MHEQKGERRAAYGAKLLKELSATLTAELGKGFSEDNLALMRKFYLIYSSRIDISETPSRKLTSGIIPVVTYGLIDARGAASTKAYRVDRRKVIVRPFDHHILCFHAPWASEKEWHPKQK